MNQHPTSSFSLLRSAARFAISALVSLPLLAQSPASATYKTDFQSQGTQASPAGWVDTSVGANKPTADGLYKTWPDPTQGKQGTNVVYGTKQASGKPEGRNPRIGTFTTLTTHEFSAAGRFEYRGRILRTDADARVGVTFLSKYPEVDSYYLFGLWSQANSSKLTMQLFASDGHALTAAEGSSLDSNITLEPNKWYGFVVRVEDGGTVTRLEAKVWPITAEEPSEFSIKATDTDAAKRLTRGRIGLWSAVRGDAYIDDIAAKFPFDLSAPVIEFYEGSAKLPSSIIVNRNPVVTIKVTDDTDPQPIVAAKLDGQPFTSGSAISGEGDHTLEVSATDSVGNTGTATLTVRIDTVRPTIDALADGVSLVDKKVFPASIVLTTTTDDFSGTTINEVLKRGDLVVPFKSGDTISEEGVYVLTATATDAAGNVSTELSRQFTIDKTKPVIELFKDDVSFSGGAFNQPLAVVVKITDLTPVTQTITLNEKSHASGALISADGEYELIVKAVDAAGNVSATSVKFVLNQNGPQITILANGAALPLAKIFKEPVKVDVSVQNYGTSTTTITLNGQPFTSGSTVSEQKREHTLVVRVQDDTGHDVQVSKTFGVDLGKPEIAVKLGETALTEGLASTAPTLSFAVTDAITTPKWTVDLDGVSQGEVSQLVLTADKKYTLKVTAIDDAGNEATFGPVSFWLDRKAPEVTLLEGTEPFPSDFYFNRSIVAAVDVEDLTATTATATIAAQSFAMPATFGTEGDHTIAVTVTDAAGNVTTLDPLPFHIDLTKPVLAITSHQTGALLAIPRAVVAGSSNEPVTVKVNGVAATMDQARTSFSDAAISLLEGRNSVKAIGTDRAGNIGDVEIQLVVDTRAPELTIASPAAESCIDTTTVTVSGSIADAATSTVEVSIAPQGSVQPVATATAQVSNGLWTATLPAGDEGRKTITIKATDAAGHTATATRTINTDRTAPSIEVTEGGAPFNAEFVSRPVALFIRATDNNGTGAGSPLPLEEGAGVRVTLDNQPYTSGTPITADGPHTLAVSATDCANHTTNKSLSFTIDTKAPNFGTFTPADKATVAQIPSSITGTIDEAISVEVVGTATKATVTSGAFTLSNLQLGEGINTLSILATDRAGNTAPFVYTLTIRTTKPAIEISENGSPILDGSLFNRNITPVIRAFDGSSSLLPGSGGGSPLPLGEGPGVRVTLNGNPYANTAITEERLHTLTAIATDSVGNSTTQTVTFTIDKTAPAIAITIPAAGNVTTDRIEVRGTAADAQSVTVNGFPAQLGSGGTFVVPALPIEIGENLIVAVGRDAAGNSGRAEVTITRQNEGPAIVLTYPADRTFTNRAKTEVLGRVLSPERTSSVVVRVEGREARVERTASIDPTGLFRISDLPLTEGANTITATATSTEGRTSSVTVTLTVDLTPPQLRVLANDKDLEEGARFATQAAINLEAADRDPVTGSLSPLAPRLSSLIIDGSTTVFPANVTAAGGHTLVATATDAAGNQTRIERTFFIGTTGAGCDLGGFDPANGSIINALTTTLVGRSGSAAGVKVNDRQAVVSNGSFWATVELTTEGDNDIRVVCTDASGNETGTPVTIKLTRVTGSPSITITTPAQLQKFGAAEVTVSGTVSADVDSPNGVDVNGTTAAVSGTTWTVKVPLTPGLNTLVARARRDGRTSSASVTVLYIKDERKLTITSPLTGYSTAAGTIDIAGTYENIEPSTLAISGTSATISTTPADSSSGTFTSSAITLSAGDNNFTITGRDALNRTATASVLVKKLTTGPSVAISSPADNTYFGRTTQTAEIRGTFTGAIGSRVEVAGVAATLSGNQFVASVSLSTFGPTPVLARVLEPSGASAHDLITVTRLGNELKVEQTFPAHNTVGVQPGVMPLVKFSAPMSLESLTGGGFRLVNAAGTAVSGTYRLEEDVLVFAPAAALTSGETYTIQLSATAQDLGGNPLTDPKSITFTVGGSAPATAPQLDAVASPICAPSIEIKGSAPVSSRLQIQSGDFVATTTSDENGRFTQVVPLTGKSGFRLVRVSIVGADGSFSPAAEAKFAVDCGGPEVVSASFDRTVNKLTIILTKDIKLSTATVGQNGAIVLQLGDGTYVGGSAILVSPTTLEVTPASSLAERTFTLSVGSRLEDQSGRALSVPYNQTFTYSDEEPITGDGNGFITGEVFDATTGRPLSGATVRVVVPANSPLPAGARVAEAGRGVRGEGREESALTEVTTETNSRGKYVLRLPEGAHTLEVSAPNFTTVWRQIIVPAGAGVVPIDIRLTKRNTSSNLLEDAGNDLSKKVTLTPMTQLPTGIVVTSVSNQSLAGLLPLGWSPYASAEVAVITSGAAANSPLPLGEGLGVRDGAGESLATTALSATLTFTVNQDAINLATQTLAAVQYDSTRDEWRILNSVVTITNNTATINITSTGAYALVYADKSPRAVPQSAVTGDVLHGVADVCAEAPCTLKKKAFGFNPPQIAPSGKAVATLTIEEAPNYPSGTAVQASIEEELQLADGSRVTDAPFATDLLVYRALDGKTGVADFHLSPSTRAAEVILQIGYEHIRIQPYPGRLDRGTLIGAEGGRVPGDDKVAIDIPAGATPGPLHASSISTTYTQPVEGFDVLGAFRLDLTRALQPAAADRDGDGQIDPIADPYLFKSARVTFSAAASSTDQIILGELLDNGTIRLASLTEAATPDSAKSSKTGQGGGSPRPAGGGVVAAGRGVRGEGRSLEAQNLTRFTTRTLDTLPLDGVVRPTTYIILKAKQPIAYATGTVRRGTATGPYIQNATVDASEATRIFGVTDTTRTTGLFSIPVPVGSFNLTPSLPSMGRGKPATFTASTKDEVLTTNLVLVAEPPSVTMTTPSATTEVALTTTVRVMSSRPLDPTWTPEANALVVTDSNTGQTIPGTITKENSALVWSLAISTNGDPTRLKPNTRYTVALTPSLRVDTGALLGQTAVFSFTTKTQFFQGGVDPNQLRITIPDEYGRSTISGKIGAVPSGSIVSALRRGRVFTEQYQTDKTSDTSFTFPAGNPGNDAITINDIIDLQVVKDGSVIAVVRLTPFVGTDGISFVAAPDVESRFTTDALHGSITAIVPAGTFAEPTLVTVDSEQEPAFADIPSYTQDLQFLSGVRIDFEGEAQKRIDLEVPAGSASSGDQLVLGLRTDSIRGPRFLMVDLVTVQGTRLTTRLGSSTKTVMTTSGTDVKSKLLGITKPGSYGWLKYGNAAYWLYTTVRGAVDLFFDNMPYLIVASTYSEATKGQVVFPVTKVKFEITGVDATTGLEIFSTPYTIQPPSDPTLPVDIPTPNPDAAGPYPVFGSPFKIEVAKLSSSTVDVAGLKLSLSKEQLTAASGSKPLPANVSVQLINVSTGFVSSSALVMADGTFSLPPVPASLGDEIVAIVGTADINPMEDVAVVFSEPLFFAETTNEAENAETYLRKMVKLERYPLGVTSSTPTALLNLTEGIRFEANANGRRFYLRFDGMMPAGRYRLTISRKTHDSSLNPLAFVQNSSIANVNDVVIEYVVRSPRGEIGSFDLNPSDVHTDAALKDMARSGNLAFVSALDGGLLAYDISDPASTIQNPKPIAFVPARWTKADGSLLTPGFDQHWAVATDHHGRIYSTGLYTTFSAVRSYRLEDFLAAAEPGQKLCDGYANAPEHSLCRFNGASVLSWRTGYAASMPLSTEFVDDLPEATPRKMQLLVQDEEGFVTAYDTPASMIQSINELGQLGGVVRILSAVPTSTAYDDGTVDLNITVTYTPSATETHYLNRRVTIENSTMGARWSADVRAGGTAIIPNVSVRKGDRIRLIANTRTWGVVSLFGYGTTLIDLNAVESNDTDDAPATYQPIREQIMLTSAVICAEGMPLHAIPDLTFTADTGVTSGGLLHLFALEANKGVVDIVVDPAKPGAANGCPQRGASLVFKNRQAGYVHPRLKPIEDKFNGAAVARFTNAAPFSWKIDQNQNAQGLRGSSNGSSAARDYLLIPGGDYGLLIAEVRGNPGPNALYTYAPLTENHLVDVVWLAAGAMSVRAIPGTELAVVVDKKGRLNLVDLSRIDERFLPDKTLLPIAMPFPSLTKALAGKAIEDDEVGADDPRVIWKSEPGLVTGTVPPLIDGATGIVLTGDALGKKMRLSSMIDPQIRVKANIGGSEKEIGNVVPLGVQPAQKLGLDSSQSVFRIEVTLPGGVSKGATGLQFAIESETLPGVTAYQTPDVLPRAHLRKKTPSGIADPRPVGDKFAFRRLIPHSTDATVTAAVEKRFRHQQGFNTFVSPWVVALADPRSSQRYKWAGEIAALTKANEGCLNCDRPSFAANKTENEGFYELWTAGRSIMLRPETGSLAGTPLSYLAENGRLEARVATVMADWVRPTSVLVAGQNPPVADGALLETVFLHSGELSTESVDLSVEGRAGWDVNVARVYRSATIGASLLGVGWDSPMFRRLRLLPNGDAELRDGADWWLFKRKTAVQMSTIEAEIIGAPVQFESPRGLFVRLVGDATGYTMFDQQWRITRFDLLGRLISESDEFYDPKREKEEGITTGNTIRYLYDERSQLAKIVDPVGRETVLSYFSESDVSTNPNAVAGLLKEVRDWKGRTTRYEYDQQHGTLTRVHLPEVRAAEGIPSELNHVGSARPRIEYKYYAVAPPEPADEIASEPYSRYLQYVGNLTSITDPSEVAKGGGGKPRVTFAYESPDQAVILKRDRVLSQEWGTGEVATFGPSSSTDGKIIDRVESVDAMQQKRTYLLARQADQRVHVTEVTTHEVPVIDVPAGSFPAKAPLNAVTPPQDLVAKFTYTDQGEFHIVTQPNGLVITNEYEAATGLIGTKLVTSKEGVLETKLKFGEGRGANIVTVLQRIDGSTGEPQFRDIDQPYPGHMTVERKEDDFKTLTELNPSGQVVTRTELALAGGEPSRIDVVVYAAENAANLLERGRPRILSSGKSKERKQSFEYSTALTDGLRVVATDEVESTITDVQYDARGAVARRVVKDATGVLSDEAFGYDANGQLVHHMRAQKGLGTVTAKMKYDVIGRLLETTTSGASVDGTLQDLSTRTLHDLAKRSTTTYDPFIGAQPANAASTTTITDGIGRILSAERTAADKSISQKSMFAYDIHGKHAFQSDGATSLLRLHDARGREEKSVDSFGIQTEMKYNIWDEPVETSVASVPDAETGIRQEVGRSRIRYTSQGRVRQVGEAIDAARFRLTRYSWSEGTKKVGTRIGEVPSIDPQIDAMYQVQFRATEQEVDSAGRTVREKVGTTKGAMAPIADDDTFLITDHQYRGSVPFRSWYTEPKKSATPIITNTSFDGLQRPTKVTAPGGYVSTFSYDEAGNVLTSRAPGIAADETRRYDSRGLLLQSTLPSGKTIGHSYDALGTMRSYVDEAGNVTTYEVDGLGRVTRVTYPDAAKSTEETRFDALGRVAATRARAKNWLMYSYDSGGHITEVHRGGNDAEPVKGGLITRYFYDGAGRLTSVGNDDATIGFFDFDRLGRPRMIKTVRWTRVKNSDGVEVGTGLTPTPVPLDVHTQAYVWSVFDNERDRYRLPVAGGEVPSNESATEWRSWIDEDHDGVGNLTAQAAASGMSTPATAPFLTTIPRSVARLNQRSRFLTSAGAALRTSYLYSDEAGDSSASGLISEIQVSSGESIIAGSKISRQPGSPRVERADDLGLGSRYSRFEYDEKLGRIELSILNGAIEAKTTRAVDDIYEDADFRSGRTVSGGFTDEDRKTLGLDTIKVNEPASWSSEGTPDHAVKSLSAKYGEAFTLPTQTFANDAGRRLGDGIWTAEYDEYQRVVAVQNTTGDKRRIEYVYDPNGRVIGRTAKQPAGAEWTLETRAALLAADGLPANCTFVWDPLTDRLMSIFEAGKSVNASDPNAGLVRQFVHGDQGYDDLVEVTVPLADAQGTIKPTRLLPVFDVAGGGSLQAVVAENGDLVERVLYADAWGDAPRYLHGPVVDEISVESKKNGAGEIVSVEVLVHLSDKINAASLANGAVLRTSTNGSVVTKFAGLPTIDAEDPYTMRWTLDAPQWSALSTTGDALEIVVTGGLRAHGWGATSAMKAPEWSPRLYPVLASDTEPVLVRESISNLNADFASGAAGKTKKTALYSVPDLYLGAENRSKVQLLLGYKAAPFVEPANGLVYLRARWYDPETGSFLTPDPMQYHDSSNLYAFAKGDPVNHSDPTGEIVSGLVNVGFTLWDAYACATGGISSAECAMRMTLNVASLTADVFTGGFGGGMAVRAVGLAGRAGRVGGVVVHGSIFVDRANTAVTATQAAVSAYEAVETGNYTRAGLSLLQVGLAVHSMRNTQDVALLSPKMRAQPWSPTYGQALKLKDPTVVPVQQSHHIIQTAAAETAGAVPGRAGYSYTGAPAVNLAGGSRFPGSEHHFANEIQRLVPLGGTYAAERQVAWLALRAAGFTRGSTRSAIARADTYFLGALGWTKKTTLTIPGTRP